MAQWNRQKERADGLFRVLAPVLSISVFFLLPGQLLFPADHEYHEQKCDADCHPHGEHSRSLCAEFVIIALQIDDDNDPG